VGGLVSLEIWRLCTSQGDTYVHSCALEEKGGLVGDQVSGEVLRCVDQACDDRSAEIDTLPEIKKRRATASVGFDFDGTFHHGESFVSTNLGVVAKAFDASQCFLLATATK
jgi:hypothetical protein